MPGSRRAREHQAASMRCRSTASSRPHQPPPMTHPPSLARPGPLRIQAPRWLLSAYVLVLVYGSLFPFRFDPGAGDLTQLLRPYRGHLSFSDVLINLAVYIPFGALLALRRPSSPLAAAAQAALSGGLLSLVVECTQSYIPARVPSLLDTALNTTGAAAGALVTAYLLRRLATTVPPLALSYHLRSTPSCWAVAGLLFLWVFAQLAPFVPSLGAGNLASSIAPLVAAVTDPSAIHPGPALAYVVAVATWARLIASCMRPDFPSALAALLGSVVLLALKVPVLGRQISAEALLGAFLGPALSRLLPAGPRPRNAVLLALATATYLAASLSPGTSAVPYPWNWIPFRPQIESLWGLVDLAGQAWLAGTVAYAAAQVWPRHTLHRPLALLLAALCFTVVEAAQGLVPGRQPDVTDLLVAAVAWLLFTKHPAASPAPAPDPGRTSERYGH
ncbi:MAG: VanZ family protein [Gammaproteobacteria bacterium]|nr:MAG: VanZ family protein [Gammaproteobacteria bacterium]